MNITFYQGNKPCKETKKSCWGVGKREGNGRKCLWPLHDSRKGVQTHFADLVNNACRVDTRPARNGSEPAAGFLFPLSQVQGSRPSSPPPPPLRTTWEPQGTCAATPRADKTFRLRTWAAPPPSTLSQLPPPVQVSAFNR